MLFADMVYGASTRIDRPIDAVWPRLLDLEAWMKDFKMTRISGENHREGAVWRATPIVNPEAMSLEEVHPFYFKTLALTPFRKFVYKAYTEHRGGEYSFSGIEALSLSDAGRASTLLTVDGRIDAGADRR